MTVSLLSQEFKDFSLFQGVTFMAKNLIVHKGFTNNHLA